MALAGCDTLKTRDEMGRETKTGAVSGQEAPFPAPPAVPGTTPTRPPPPQSTEFLRRELPRVGLILGAGGMKAFAHLGVLREINQARIPIHAVTGLEWGALMGGLYAMQAQVNEAEWKAFKLRKESLPETGGLLNPGLEARPISELREFFKDAFGSSLLEKSKVEFSCGSYSNKHERLMWLSRGSARDAVSKCIAYPPLYRGHDGFRAAPFAVDEAAAWLRAHGANVIILVNVLARGEMVSDPLNSEHSVESVLWNEVRAEYASARPPAVTYVIEVDTSGHPLTDFDGRRALMDAGGKAASDLVKKLSSLYGF